MIFDEPVIVLIKYNQLLIINKIFNLPLVSLKSASLFLTCLIIIKSCPLVMTFNLPYFYDLWHSSFLNHALMTFNLSYFCYDLQPHVTVCCVTFLLDVHRLSEDEDEDRNSKQKRGILPKQATQIMKSWLFQHIVVCVALLHFFFHYTRQCWTCKVIDQCWIYLLGDTPYTCHQLVKCNK